MIKPPIQPRSLNPTHIFSLLARHYSAWRSNVNKTHTLSCTRAHVRAIKIPSISYKHRTQSKHVCKRVLRQRVLRLTRGGSRLGRPRAASSLIPSQIWVSCSWFPYCILEFCADTDRLAYPYLAWSLKLSEYIKYICAASLFCLHIIYHGLMNETKGIIMIYILVTHGCCSHGNRSILVAVYRSSFTYII